MPTTQFDPKLTLTKDGLEVAGPFEAPSQSIIGHAIVRFLIIQVNKDDAGGQPAIVEDVAEWNSPDANWAKHVSRDRIDTYKITGGRARGIGVAVIVQQADPSSIPSIQTLTWCQDVEIDDTTPSRS
jgi:hypothetical protein